jgi:hypothetical protein
MQTKAQCGPNADTQRADRSSTEQEEAGNEENVGIVSGFFGSVRVVK